MAPTQSEMDNLNTFKQWAIKEMNYRMADIISLKGSYKNQLSNKLSTMMRIEAQQLEMNQFVAVLEKWIKKLPKMDKESTFDVNTHKAYKQAIKEYAKTCELPKDWQAQKDEAQARQKLREERKEKKQAEKLESERITMLHQLWDDKVKTQFNIDIQIAGNTQYSEVKALFNKVRELIKIKTLNPSTSFTMDNTLSELLMEKSRLENFERLNKWRNFESSYIGYLEFTALRVNQNGEIETSKGIRLSKEDSLRAIASFRSGRLLGQQFQHYKVTTVDNVKRVVIAGCHTIPFDEIEQAEIKIRELIKT
jgi:hypothetical protein